MAKVLPIFLALMFSFFSQCFAYYNTQYIPGKLIYSSYIIRFALYFLLLESPLYVRSFRKLHSIPESIFQVSRKKNFKLVKFMYLFIISVYTWSFCYWISVSICVVSIRKCNFVCYTDSFKNFVSILSTV